MKALAGKRPLASGLAKLFFFEEAKKIMIKRVFSWVVKIIEGVLVLVILGLGITGLVIHSLEIAGILLLISGGSLLAGLGLYVLNRTGWSKYLPISISNPSKHEGIFSALGVAATVFVALIIGLPVQIGRASCRERV